MKKRILAILLCAAMLLPAAPPAKAETEFSEVSEVSSAATEASEVTSEASASDAASEPSEATGEPSDATGEPAASESDATASNAASDAAGEPAESEESGEPSEASSEASDASDASETEPGAKEPAETEGDEASQFATVFAVTDGVQTSLSLDNGAIVISNDSVTVGGTAVEADPDGYIITQTSATTTNNVIVKPGTEVSITLNGVNIDTSATRAKPAFSIGDAGHPGTGSMPASTKVTIVLQGSNTLKSGAYCAGLQTNQASTLHIKGTGSLSATGKNSASGIGGGAHNSSDNYLSATWYSSGGTIVIWEGTITANSGTTTAPGIGDGDRYDDSLEPHSNIYILGGEVHALGGGANANDTNRAHSADIGGSGNWGLNGGTVQPSYSEYKGKFSTVYTDENGDVHTGTPIIYADTFTDEPSAMPGIFVRADASGVPVYHIYESMELPDGFSVPANAKLETADGVILTTTHAEPTVMDLALGSIRISKKGIYYCNPDGVATGVATYNSKGYRIIQSNNATPTSNRIFVDEGLETDIILAGVNVEQAADVGNNTSLGARLRQAAMYIGFDGTKENDFGHMGNQSAYYNKGTTSGTFTYAVMNTDVPEKTTVNLVLEDGTVNTLKSGYFRAGLQTNANSVLHIRGEGTLYAHGGAQGAGIGGGGHSFDGSAPSYSPTAEAHRYRSGIWYSGAGEIYLWGGNVFAYGGANATGIGSGDRTDDEFTNTKVYVLGGKITACGNGRTDNTTGSGSDDIGASDNEGNPGTEHDGKAYEDYFHTTYEDENGNIVNGNAIIDCDSFSGLQPEESGHHGVFIDGNGNYHVYGDTTLGDNLEIPEDKELNIHEGATLTVPKDTTLDIEGDRTGEGNLIIDGNMSQGGQDIVEDGVLNDDADLSGSDHVHIIVNVYYFDEDANRTGPQKAVVLRESMLEQDGGGKWFLPPGSYGWYYVHGTLDVEKRFYIQDGTNDEGGRVGTKIILGNNSTLNANHGIDVSATAEDVAEGKEWKNTLTIYQEAPDLDENGAVIESEVGVLNAHGTSKAADGTGFDTAGIGGGDWRFSEGTHSGAIYIYGGSINVSGAKTAANIGSGEKGVAGPIVIKNAKVTSGDAGTAASIGAGSGGSLAGFPPGVVNVHIENSIVLATSDATHNGIGDDTDATGNIIIKDSVVFTDKISAAVNYDNSLLFLNETGEGITDDNFGHYNGSLKDNAANAAVELALPLVMPATATLTIKNGETLTFEPDGSGLFTNVRFENNGKIYRDYGSSFVPGEKNVVVGTQVYEIVKDEALEKVTVTGEAIETFNDGKTYSLPGYTITLTGPEGSLLKEIEVKGQDSSETEVTKDTDNVNTFTMPAIPVKISGELVERFDLTITTKNSDTALDPKQTYVFLIENEDKSVVLKIVLRENETRTVRSLPYGTYTVTEQSGWSWRYAQMEAQTADHENNELTFTVTRNIIKWLDGNSYKLLRHN